jgi:hypothetical protein
MRKVVLALVAALSALLAVPALAVDGTLSSANRTYAWEGGPLTGVPSGNVPANYSVIRCTAVYQCDNEHIELKEAGSLVVDIKAGSGSEDLDVRLYASDASGTAPGTPAPGQAPDNGIAADERPEKDAKLTVKNLKPGFYVIQVAAFTARNGMYTGTATFTPTTTTPPQQTSPTPAENKASDAKRKKRLKACNKKAKKIKNKKKRKAAQKKCARKYGKKKT